MSLNLLPDGSPSPQYKCTAVNYEGEEKTVILTEWWNKGKLIETISQSAENYFYDAFDKAPFNLKSTVKISEAGLEMHVRDVHENRSK